VSTAYFATDLNDQLAASSNRGGTSRPCGSTDQGSQSSGGGKGGHSAFTYKQNIMAPLFPLNKTLCPSLFPLCSARRQRKRRNGDLRSIWVRGQETRAKRKALAQRNASGTETGVRLVWRARPSASRFHSRAGFQTPIFPSIRALSWFAATPWGPKQCRHKSSSTRRIRSAARQRAKERHSAGRRALSAPVTQRHPDDEFMGV
jgi:hypothetical protein